MKHSKGLNGSIAKPEYKIIMNKTTMDPASDIDRDEPFSLLSLSLFIGYCNCAIVSSHGLFFQLFFFQLLGKAVLCV